MSDVRQLLERGVGAAMPPPDGFERMLRRRDRKRRNQRIRASALGLLIVAAGAAIAAQVVRSDLPAVPLPPQPSPSPDFEPSPAPPLDPEPLIRLAPGAYFVNVVTGEAVALPSGITSVPGAGNFEVSPDGTMIAFDNAGFRPRAGDGVHQIYVANIDGTRLRRLTDHPIAAVEPVWSPDGTKVVYLAGRDPSKRWTRLPVELSVVDVTTGATSIPFTDRAAKDLAGPLSFTPDGRSILFWRGHLGYGRGLWAVPVAGGRPEPFLEDRSWYSGAPSPDGSTLALQRLSGWMWNNAGGTCSELWLADADGRDPRRFTGCLDEEGQALAWGASLSGGWSPDGQRVAYSVRRYTAGERRVVILDVETGVSTVLAAGRGLDWLDDETLIVVNAGPRGRA